MLVKSIIQKPLVWILYLCLGVMFLIFLGYSAGHACCYDPDMTPVYAGMVKPYRGVNDYNGNCMNGNPHYSTCYLGKYMETEIVNGTPVKHYFNEGSGSHPGVDMLNGTCSPIYGVGTPIRAVASGVIVDIQRWEPPGWTPTPVCQGNSETGKMMWGNLVVVRHDDGDRQAERAIFRPSTGLWSICTEIVDITESACLLDEYTLGQQGDIPVPGDYDGDGYAEWAIFRPGTGTWEICLEPYLDVCILAEYTYGQQGDIPAEKRPAYAGYPYGAGSLDTLAGLGIRIQYRK